jgi:hypothetical protein
MFLCVCFFLFLSSHFSANNFFNSIISLSSSDSTSTLSTAAVTPQGLASVTATETRQGLAEIATQAETNPSFCPIQRPASAQACNTFPCPTQDVTEFS